ncbi:hypothetical protein [Geoglobus sp.]
MHNMPDTEILAKELREMLKGNCLDFSNNIDGCRIKSSEYILKVKFDKCADKNFDVDGGCDCIFILRDKVAIVECTRGNFGSRDAIRKPEQLKKCYEVVRRLGYSGLIVMVIYFRHISNTAKSRAEIELKNLKRKDKKLILKFLKCGRDKIS